LAALKKETMDINKVNYLGTITALVILITCNLIFIFRLLGLSKIEYWLGIIFILNSLPIVFLLFYANDFRRPPIYYVQLGVMLTFIIAELFLDYIFKVDFRNTRWMVIAYATLFFGATGGMIGIASLSGRIFSIISILLFLVMSFLAFFQRAKTGM
jgi:hypothetical protein